MQSNEDVCQLLLQLVSRLHSSDRITRFDVFRWIWLLIFLVASILLVYLVTTKLLYLLSYPKNVNVDFNFNASLPFPAVTICNESPYRYHCVYAVLV